MDFLNTMNGSKIPFFGLTRQYSTLKDELLSATNEVLSSGQYISGEKTRAFESWLANKNQYNYAVAVHNGTQALEIASKFVFEITKPTKIFVPTLTFPATANAVINNGYDIEFVDSDDYGQTSKKFLSNYFDIFNSNIDTEFDGILIQVGLYGESVFSSPLRTTIEDAAQHWLAVPKKTLHKGRAQSLVRTISFDPTKNLPSSGSGGAILSNDENLIRKIRSYIAHGTTENLIGTNSRMSEIEAAHLMVRAQYIDQWQERRREIAKYYISRFNEYPIRPVIRDVETHALQKFVIAIDGRDEVFDSLNRDGIEVKIHYKKPLHELPQYKKYVGPGFLSQASALCRQVLSLPIYPELTDAEVEYIADRVIHHTCAYKSRATTATRN